LPPTTRSDPDVDVCRLIHTEQQRRLLDETDLAVARPQAQLRFTLLDRSAWVFCAMPGSTSSCIAAKAVNDVVTEPIGMGCRR
jgi:hypothetical protein